MSRESFEQAARLIIGAREHNNREGLRETPQRFARAFEFWTSGYDNEDPAKILKAFEDGAQDADEMVLQTDIPFYSMCEHHLAPFFGKAHIGYIPNGKIVGLSKLARLVDMYSRRLQVQERITTQVAKALEEVLQPVGVGVVLQARHLCMESRGVQKAGTITTTSALLGAMKEVPEARSEFLSLVRRPDV